jgi:acyl carrier protein
MPEAPAAFDDVVRDLAAHVAAEAAGGPLPEPPAPDDPIIAAGVIDSLGLFDLVAFVERRYGLAIPSEEIVLENFLTVRALATFVLAKLAVRA